MRTTMIGLVVTVALAAASQPTMANIVQNPGFEADITSLSDPTILSPTDWTVTGDAGVDSAFPNSGNNDAFIGSGSLSQLLTTVVGATYVISFYAGVNDFNLYFDSAATFGASFGTVDLLNGGIAPSDVPLGGYSQFIDTVTASATSTTISFTGAVNGADGTWYLDDVSVEAQTSAVPEPSGTLLLLSAVGLTALLRYRRT